jgi:hypothetical protein
MDSAPPAVMERFPRLNVAQQGPQTRCKSCSHWFAHPPQANLDLKAERLGMCKRYPPKMFLCGAAQTPAGVVPQFTAGQISTGENDFCGEYEPRLSVKVQ